MQRVVRDAGEPVGGRIGAGEHREHAGRGERRRRLDASDPGVRVRRTHEGGVSLAVDVDVVGKAPAPGQ